MFERRLGTRVCALMCHMTSRAALSVCGTVRVHVFVCACVVPWRALVCSGVWLFFCAREPPTSHVT